jgi:fido (protein-threonine AMPylation protein)
MTATYPTWHTEQAPAFDAIMSKAGSDILDRLRSDLAFRVLVLNDPRVAHKILYEPFAPANYPEYAGTYRGTANSTLEHRLSSAQSIIDPSRTITFAKPSDVLSAMAWLIPEMAGMRSRAVTPWDQLWSLTNFFIQFGKIHPFLDGNGHLQRVLFAAGAMEMRIPLSCRFAIHPRPFDFLLAYALEKFSDSQNHDDQSRWGMAVAEYLAQWLGGQFDAPGSGMPPI